MIPQKTVYSARKTAVRFEKEIEKSSRSNKINERTAQPKTAVVSYI